MYTLKALREGKRKDGYLSRPEGNVGKSTSGREKAQFAWKEAGEAFPSTTTRNKVSSLGKKK